MRSVSTRITVHLKYFWHANAKPRDMQDFDHRMRRKRKQPPHRICGLDERRRRDEAGIDLSDAVMPHAMPWDKRLAT